MSDEENQDADQGATLAVEDDQEVNFDSISDIPVEVSATLGRASMPVSKLLELSRGAVVTLDKKVGEAIEIYVNDRLVAKGEVVIVENKIGITMTEIIKHDRD